MDERILFAPHINLYNLRKLDGLQVTVNNNITNKIMLQIWKKKKCKLTIMSVNELLRNMIFANDSDK